MPARIWYLLLSRTAILMRVLLVDDNEELREFLALTLTESQIDTVAVADGEAALAQIEASKFDVIIVDSVMPGEDGIGLTQKIRATKAGARVPILIMSALTTALVRRMATAAGANDFLPKPFSQQQILEQVRKLGRA